MTELDPSEVALGATLGLAMRSLARHWSESSPEVRRLAVTVTSLETLDGLGRINIEVASDNYGTEAGTPVGRDR